MRAYLSTKLEESFQGTQKTIRMAEQGTSNRRRPPKERILLELGSTNRITLTKLPHH
jgi:hypothetical protein